MSWSPPVTYASNAQAAYLAQFFLGTPSSPDSYVAMVEVVSIKTDDFTVTEIDFTHLLSPNSTEESGPGLAKPGNVEVTGHFTGDATQWTNPIDLATGQSTAGLAPIVCFWQVKSPVARNTMTYTAQGSGYVTKFALGPFENNKPIDVALSLKITGQPTRTVA